MKKSRIAKISLMGASIAALAATLTTSTYAWYVSNKTANTTAVTGNTTAGTADGSISLSLTGKEGSFKREITLGALTGTLSPVDRTGATSNPVYKVLDEQTDADDETQGKQIDATANPVDGTAHYTIEFYILAAANCTVNPLVKVANTTTSFPTQVSYSTAGKVGGVTDGNTFTVDARTAMHYSVRQEQGSWVTTAGETKGNYVTGTQVVDKTEKLGATAFSSLEAMTGSTLSAYNAVTYKATGGAQAYYNEITKTTLVGEAVTSYAPENSGIAALSLTKNVPYKLTYEFWLDGAEATCFNCCAGQSFTIAFEYTVASVTQG